MTRIRTRTQRFELRMTPGEKESWSAASAAVGIDLSEYIRRCVERRQMNPKKPEVNSLLHCFPVLKEEVLPRSDR